MFSPDVAKRPWLVRLAPVREWRPVARSRDEAHEQDVELLDGALLVVKAWELRLGYVLVELVPYLVGVGHLTKIGRVLCRLNRTQAREDHRDILEQDLADPLD